MLALLLAALHLGAADSGRTISRETFDATDGVQVFPVYLSPAAWHVPSDISGSAFV